MDPVSLLLACPRGRRLCANVASVADAAAEFALNPHTDADPVRALADLDPTVITGLSESDLLDALGLAGDFARYWQPPDDEDLLYARSDVVQALRPAAEAAIASPHAAWWGEPLDREHQRLTSYFERDEGWTDWPLHHRHDDRDLSRWREHVLANESRFHDHYAANPDRKLSGEWWSTPEPSLTWSTTRAREGLGALELLLVEDSFDLDQACVWPIRIGGELRVYEIAGPADWARLVDAYPWRSRSRGAGTGTTPPVNRPTGSSPIGPPSRPTTTRCSSPSTATSQRPATRFR